MLLTRLLPGKDQLISYRSLLPFLLMSPVLFPGILRSLTRLLGRPSRREKLPPAHAPFFIYWKD